MKAVIVLGKGCFGGMRQVPSGCKLPGLCVDGAQSNSKASSLGG